MKPMTRWVPMLAGAAMLLGVLLAAIAGSAQAAAKCTTYHRVKASDPLPLIAQYYHVPLPRLAAANGLKRPYDIQRGDKLCIPAAPQRSADWEWEATLKNGRVEVEGKDFKKQYTFYLKVRESDTSKFIKLGKLVTDKNGDLKGERTLPVSLKHKEALWVCLKDGVTDYLDCRWVVRD